MNETRTTWPEQLEILRNYARQCTRCRLRSGCTQVVFGVGNPNTSVMLVGEGPGRQEDAQGEPFVGPAGTDVLNKILDRMNVSREEIYISNIVKCQPPRNRVPTKDEIEACNWIISQEIDFVNPRVILALGSTAAKALTGKNIHITKDRGKWYEYKDIPVMVTFHPAYVLHSESHKTTEEIAQIKWATWNDFNEAFKKAQTLEVH